MIDRQEGLHVPFTAVLLDEESPTPVGLRLSASAFAGIPRAASRTPVLTAGTSHSPVVPPGGLRVRRGPRDLPEKPSN